MSTLRRWKREQKLAILAQVDVPGGSVSEVARRHRLHTGVRSQVAEFPLPAGDAHIADEIACAILLVVDAWQRYRRDTREPKAN